MGAAVGKSVSGAPVSGTAVGHAVGVPVGVVVGCSVGSIVAGGGCGLDGFSVGVTCETDRYVRIQLHRTLSTVVAQDSTMAWMSTADVCAEKYAQEYTGMCGCVGVHT